MRRLALVFLLLAAASSLAAGAGAANDISQAVAAQRALQVYALMQRYFYDPGTGGYAGTYPLSGNGHAQVWPYSQAFEATLQVASLTGGGAEARATLPKLIAELAPYRATLAGRGQLAYAPIYGGFGNLFYDDNVWVGIELLGTAQLLGDTGALADAEQVFAWIETGWDTTSVCPGGVYWLMPGGPYWNHSPLNRYRTAVSTANAALLGVELYAQTHVRADLAFAERAYAWSQRCLGTPSGLVADHIAASGAVTVDIHSYNQGAMVAAAVDLYRATGRRSYLQEALQTANAALAYFRYASGDVEPAVFLAIFYGDLAPLIPLAASDPIRTQIAAFADRAWTSQRDGTTGLFRFGHTFATLLDQAAMVQIYSELAKT